MELIGSIWIWFMNKSIFGQKNILISQPNYGLWGSFLPDEMLRLKKETEVSLCLDG